jgi:hypothetical protein
VRLKVKGGSSRKRVGGKLLTHVTSVVDVQAHEVWFKVKAVGKREPFVLYGSVFKYHMAINAIKVFAVFK